MKRYLSRALPIAAMLVLLAGSGAIRAQTSQTCTNPGPPCVNPIKVDAADCNKSTTTYEETHFPQKVSGNPNRDILVKWTLPTGYGFCPTAGDGVFLKDSDPHDQFTPKGFDNPPGTAPCRRKSVMMQAKNTKSGLKYPYRIQFHSDDGKKSCTIDPAMIND